MFAALAGGLALIAAVAMIGPRNSGLFGADDATADEPPAEVPVDDGVVFTAPGELVELFEPPETSTVVTTAGSATATTTSAVAPPAPTPSPTQTTVSTQGTLVDQATDVTSSSLPTTSTQPNAPGDTGEGSELDSGMQSGDPASTGSIGENASVTASEQALQAGAVLLAAPELRGTARGSTVSGPQLTAQVGTRDVNSVPWMLLIAANFGVTVSALVLLRLRR
ncbi:MAG: hypothetical protein GXP35_06775 [Actinobacteria bacterium]|nr:hypothetical protein [Actinomycetota bacterium]